MSPPYSWCTSGIRRHETDEAVKQPNRCVYLAVDGVALHGEMFASVEATFTDCTDEAIDMVDLLAGVHD